MVKQKNKNFKKEDMISMAEILKAAAHPDRLAMLSLLYKSREKRLSVKAIYEKLSIQQPIVSRHLKILKDAGVVRKLQEGRKIFYCLSVDKINIVALLRCYS
jgi:ArsR family transcriptional regulator